MDQTNFHIVRCSDCGAANRIPAEKIEVAAKCGKCGSLLIAVVINMFRLPDFLTGENVMSNGLKLLQT